MIFKKNVVLVVDAYSIGSLIAPAFISRGYECIHVRSTNNVNEFYESWFRKNDFIADLHYQSDSALDEALSQYNVQFVLAGCEFGVELAAYLAGHFNVARHNDPANAILWRNKYQMHEALKNAGVRSIQHFKSANLQEIQSWIEQHDLFPVVLKPIDSAGSDNIHICTKADEVASAFETIKASRNIFLTQNKEVLVQQYLDNSDFLSELKSEKGEDVDIEYCVNTVSVDGQHFVSEIIRVYRTRIGSAPVHDYNQLMCPIDNHDVYRRLSEYIFSVLDALGIEQGVGHSELMIVDDQPVLLETAARMPGGIDLSAYTRALGHNQLNLWVESLLNPQGFLEYRAKPRKKLFFHSSCVFLIARSSGTIRQFPDIGVWKHIPGLHSIKIQHAGVLSETNSLENSPGHVFILDKDRSAINDSIQLLREAESTIYQGMLK
ncbi:ATP-grasp domain-containing protein [Pseudomonas syringae]|uniref:ATP-grasp domain-containing protein n=1 Tax=Pseudomonas syringae TaxID=317 RepID=UPI001BCEF123|nr:ATP-grasp domain-containing protein [Pseudomonas syringae]MDF5832674.1 ATP-grasp domain-containing protein [Pseudomonas syringae]QVK32558.1 ATP-grasp domain-containing protein [Pseudomonas syringae]